MKITKTEKQKYININTRKMLQIKGEIFGELINAFAASELLYGCLQDKQYTQTIESLMKMNIESLRKIEQFMHALFKECE